MAFSIYINDLPSTPSVLTNLFNDITMFLTTIKGTQHAANQIQKQKDVTLPWPVKWKIWLNTNKTEAIKYGYRIREVAYIRIGDRHTQRIKGYQYLGEHFDSCLKFNKNINEIVKKSRKTVYALHLILNHQNPLTISTKKYIVCQCMFCTYIRSKITYADLACYGLISISNWGKLKRIQHTIFRKITKSAWFVQNFTILGAFKLPPMRNIIN